MRKARLLLADDHAIFLEGLTRLLEPEFEVAGKAEDGRQMLEMSARLKPDVIVADISMPLLSGIEAVRQLRKKDCRTKVIFLSMHADIELASQALRLGASGYVLKHSAAESLSRAIHAVLKGGTYVSPRISVDVLSTVQQTSRHPERPAVVLTQREREVLQLVSEGRTIRGIANILDIAGRTVVFHKCQPDGQTGTPYYGRIDPLRLSERFVGSRGSRLQPDHGARHPRLRTSVGPFSRSAPRRVANAALAVLWACLASGGRQAKASGL